MTNNTPPQWNEPSTFWRLNTNVNQNPQEGPVGLLRSASIIARRHKGKLIICTLIGLVAGVVYAHSLPRNFTSTATLLLEPRRQAVATGQDGSSQGLDPNRADSELQIIRSERLLTAVFDSLDLIKVPELSQQQSGKLDAITTRFDEIAGSLRQYLSSSAPDDSAKTSRATLNPSSASGEDSSLARQIAFQKFQKRIDARRVGQSYVIEVDYTSTDPSLTATVANAIASAYILQSVAFKMQMAVSGTEALQWRLDSLKAQVEAATNAMQHGTLPSIPTPDADARVIGAALPPLGPSGSRASLIVALGGILGLLGGISVLALSVAFRRKMHTATELARETGIVCLAAIPEQRKRPKMKRLSDLTRVSAITQEPNGAYARSVRDLRTSIEIASASVRAKRHVVVGFASCDEFSGAAALSLDLSLLISRSGHEITLFHSNTIPSRYGDADVHPSAPINVVNFLMDDLTIEQTLLNTEADSGVRTFPIYSPNAESNLLADFRDKRLLKMFETARAESDVLVELPPLSKTTDGLSLAIHADVVLLVITAGKTSSDEAIEAIQRLRRAGVNVIGTVMNRTREH